MEAPSVGLIRGHCRFCGKEFFASRSNADYCSASCKQKMYRWRLKLRAKEEKMIYLVRDIASYLTYEDSTPSALLVLNKVITEALSQIDKHNVKRVK